MCTLSWHDTAEGYRLFFNRDERRERGPELPPRLERRGRTRFIAPRDGDFGGTWIAVNEHGLSVCLLNGFPATGKQLDNPGREYSSRGLLPISLIEHHSTPPIAADLSAADLGRYRPFLLVAFAPAGAGLLARWSGADLEIDEGRPPVQPLVSSSFYTEQVRNNRRAVFEELVRGGSAGPTSAHLAFHAGHRPERGPHSPCMHRPDASTVSFSSVDVTRHEILFYYAPNSPCRGIPQAPTLRLARSAVRARGLHQ